MSESTCFLSDPLAFVRAFYADPAHAPDQETSSNESTGKRSTLKPSEQDEDSEMSDAELCAREGGDGRLTREVLCALLPAESSAESNISSQGCVARSPRFLRREWLPTHVALFDAHVSRLHDWLSQRGYREVAIFFHSPFGDERSIRVFSCL